MPAPPEQNLEPADADPVLPRASRGPQVHFTDRPGERASLRELDAQLQVAIRRHRRYSALFKQGVLGRDQYESSADEIRLLAGRLRGMDDELGEEADRLKVELVRKRSELAVSQAHAEHASTGLARATRLFENKSISREEMSKYETDAKVGPAEVESKRAEMQEVELRMAQVDKRRSVIQITLSSLAKAVPGLNEQGE